MYIIDNDTKVVVTGFGEVAYPNIPTFQEVTTLNKSLDMIVEHLETQTKYPEYSYLFSVNILDTTEFVYSYLDGTVSFAEKFADLKVNAKVDRRYI